MARSDQVLLDELRFGSRGTQSRAFGDLSARYELRLLAYARRLSRGDANHAVDLVQDTWLELLVELARGRLVLQGDTAGPVLATILRSRASRRHRRTGEVLMTTVDLVPASQPHLDDRIDRLAVIERVQHNPHLFPIHHAVLVEHQNHTEVRDQWCSTTGSTVSAFYKSRQRESDELRDGLHAVRQDA